MQLQLDIPSAGFRPHGPSTSSAAAESAKDLQARHYRIILKALTVYGPMGKDGIASRCELMGHQVGKRLAELERMGKAEPTGKVVTSAAGRSERQWRAC